MSDSIDFAYNLIKDKGVLALSDCQGSCPCGNFNIRGIQFQFSCWRCNDGFSLFEITPHYDFFYSDEDLNKLGQLCLESIKEVWNNTEWRLKINRTER